MAVATCERRRRHHHHEMVSLATLISKELKDERVDMSCLRYGCAPRSKKGIYFFFIKTDYQHVIAYGGEVGRLNIVGGTEIGPLQCWIGGCAYLY